MDSSREHVLVTPEVVSDTENTDARPLTTSSGDKSYKHLENLRKQMKLLENELQTVSESRKRDRKDYNKLVLNDYDTLLLGSHFASLMYHAAKAGCDLFASGVPDDPVLARISSVLKRNWNLYCLVDDLSSLPDEEHERYAKTKVHWPAPVGLFEKYITKNEDDITLVETPPIIANLKRKFSNPPEASGSNSVPFNSPRQSSPDLEYVSNAEDHAYTASNLNIKEEEDSDIDLGSKKKQRTA
ncbi:hypothetical protein EIP86_007356 [Pleurotus ostreatoroseus]|nr:hypothetical protein EIP86_007356 [Pleurotus ostreatoroseus]